jgi:hypothetical protein
MKKQQKKETKILHRIWIRKCSRFSKRNTKTNFFEDFFEEKIISNYFVKPNRLITKVRSHFEEIPSFCMNIINHHENKNLGN